LEDTSTLVKSIDEEREFESVDLSAVLETELERVRENHPEVALETDIDAGLVVTADSLLQQLFGNLLGNAVAHNDPTSLTITVTAGEDEGMAEVVVSDTGTGIPPADRDRLFELGERGADSDGDGIGLYLVSRLATLYGGGVDVEDAPGGGALFRVRLPLADGEQP
jgi:signal transduction histidine kinase